ncbi:MAG: N-acylneuraminate cytidylyltransferase [Lachnospiraceae bacterium]|nr:N-acylneuraminate cytidylyltransferase [Lachnospiraceae bacterium]
MNVAFIPVRGGSKSIPLKNIKELHGRPLVYWTVVAACDCGAIDRVFVATDDIDIRLCVEKFCAQDLERFRKVNVIDRSEESATDTASTEFAMIEFAKKHRFDNIVLIQATSPMLTGADLDNGFAIFASNGTDSVLSVVPQKRFIWGIDDDGNAKAVNYDVYKRPRRQDFEEYYVENGAFYITSRKALLNTGNRLSGNIRVSLMSEDTYYEIDEPDDWFVTEALMNKREQAKKEDTESVSEDDGAHNSSSKCKYKMFLTDCDGCMTDAGMYYSEKGDELKKFNTRDGVGFKLLRENGIITGVITGEDVALNKRRCEKLKIDVLAQGCIDKAATINRLCATYKIKPEEVVYVGDDLADRDAVEMVGLGCCPADACAQVKEAADYITEAKGGEGVIREVCEKILGEAGRL